METSLFIGRWQPLHEGHKRLIATELDAGNRVIIGIRDTGLDVNNPFTVAERQAMIWQEYKGKVRTIVIPDFDTICYGRGVGYEFREIHLDKKTEAISGTAIREEMG